MKLDKMVSHKKEKQELENIRKTYGKKPKECPKCKEKMEE